MVLALSGGTVYVSPADEPVPDGVVVIRDDVVVAVGSRALVRVPPDAAILDCSGMTVAAGFWNSHVHFFERKWADAKSIPVAELATQLQDYLRFGFTSVFDLGSVWENTRHIRDRIESGAVAGPSIRSTGEPLLPTGALPSDDVLRVMGFVKFSAPEITNEREAAEAAKSSIGRGVQGIKIFASAPRGTSLPARLVQAAVREAHQAHKPVFVHPNTGADILESVHGGVDIIAHTTPYSGPWDETIIGAMSHGGVALTPTLNVWKYFMRHDRLSTQRQIVETAVDQLRAWAGRGGTVLFGTDVGAVDYDPTEEYLLMTQAGMSFPQILASLTTAPAELFAEASSGRVAEGLQADLVVLRGDPAKDIAALASVQYTICRGKVTYRRAVTT